MNSTKRFALLSLILVFWRGYVEGIPARADALERINLVRLKKIHEHVIRLQGTRRELPPDAEFQDVRAQMHLHSKLSHDSRAELDEILAAARLTNSKVLLFTEHPSKQVDFYSMGHQGVHDGILCIPGAETNGLLIFPSARLAPPLPEDPQQLATTVVQGGGLAFLSHLEERLDWNLTDLTGTEIYNTHADVKDEARFVTRLSSPLGVLQFIPAVKEFPQETFAAIQDYPRDYLKRFDELCQIRRQTGIAANDAHHNQAIRLKLRENQQVVLEDGLQKELAKFELGNDAILKGLAQGHAAGDVLFELDLDPYERSFRHVSTHLLVRELTHEQVWDALRNGRAYVSFDWIADPSGFVFECRRNVARHVVGSELKWGHDLSLHLESVHEGVIKIFANGELVAEHQGGSFDYVPQSPGVYRAEVWLDLAGEWHAWILSNPIFLRSE